MNTILVVEAVRYIPWTKPEDISIEINGPLPEEPLPKFGGIFAGGFNALFGDGSVKFFKDSIKPETLKALLTKAGGEVIDPTDF